jgi:hypothetical protein
MPSDKQEDAMRISVGIDIAKEIHWVTAIDAGGVVQVDRKLLNTPAGIATLVDELTALRGPVRIGLDVIGGIVVRLRSGAGGRPWRR